MPTSHTTRKLEVYSLHARTSDGPVDYPGLFGDFAAMQAPYRQLELGDRLIALPRLRVSGDRVAILAYEGPIGVNPLIFNAARSRARLEPLAAREVLATATHALIDVRTREAIVEYNHRGAKAADLARGLEHIGQRFAAWATLTVELNPVADEAFVNALDRFDRIRVASLRVARPNIDWSDHYNNLTQVASDSEARTVEVTLTATRGSTLSKRNGIVAFIRQLASEGLSILKGAKVEGVREGEAEPTRISLQHYIEHQKVDVRTTKGHVNSPDIESKMKAFLDSRRQRQRRHD